MPGKQLASRAEVIERLFQSMLGGDPDPTTFIPDLVYEQHFGNTAGIYRGAAGLRLWVDAFEEIWVDATGRIGNFREAGERVVADWSVTVRGGQSDIEVEIRGSGVYGFDTDGRVARFDHYNEPSELEAALKRG